MGSVEEGSIPMGPMVDAGETRWSFVTSRRIFYIEVREGPLDERGEIGIRSISFTDADGFEYGHYGYRFTSVDEHEKWIKRVYLRKRNKEHLTSIKGSFGIRAGMKVITSLTFSTNQNEYGPFGDAANGTNFDFEYLIDGGVVVGFYGRSSSWVEALGVYVMPRSIEECILVGPWGLTRGQQWSFKSNYGIKLIIVVNGQLIKSISCQDASGQRSELFGNKDPNPDDQEKAIEIDTSPEYLTSLTFDANDKTYGPIGSDSFIPIKDGVVVGLHGISDNCLHALGYFVKPRYPKTKITIGPWGGEGGSKWTFIPTDGVNEVIVRYEGAVVSVAFRDTSSFLSQIFGGGDPEVVGTRKVIDIEWPSEYFTCISGTYGAHNYNLVITSLSFKTNWNSYGPFGIEKGTNFSSKTDNCVIVGFFGRAGYFLDSIGVYARPLHVKNNKISEVAGTQEKCKAEEGTDNDELP